MQKAVRGTKPKIKNTKTKMIIGKVKSYLILFEKYNSYIYTMGENHNPDRKLIN